MVENPQEENVEKVQKECPMFKAPCLQSGCGWWMELIRATPGPHGGFKKETFGMCSIPALCEIMSSRPVAAPMPQQRPQIQLPRNLGRG